MLRAGRDHQCDTVAESVLFPVEQGDTGARLDADELVVAFVLLEADLFAGRSIIRTSWVFGPVKRTRR